MFVCVCMRVPVLCSSFEACLTCCAEQETLSLRAVLLHNDPIKSAAWDPTAQRIAITTGASKLFFWSADSAMCVDIPAADFSANTLSWCTQRDGAQAIVLNDALPNAAKQSSCNFFCVRTASISPPPLLPHPTPPRAYRCIYFARLWFSQLCCASISHLARSCTSATSRKPSR